MKMNSDRKLLLILALAAMIACIVLLIAFVGFQGPKKQETGEPAETESVKSEAPAPASENAESETMQEETTTEAATAEDPEVEAPALPERDIKPLENVSQTGDDTYTCTYDGIDHVFIVKLAENTEGGPLLLALHGYGESAAMMQSKVHLEEEANPLGYSVVYVTGAVDAADPTSSTGWNAGNGIGTNKDVEFLCSMTQYLQQEYGFDPGRCYVAGFSNGAFMTQRLATEAGDVFSAIISVAGLMPEKIWEEKEAAVPISVFQVTGEKDDLIPKNSDGSAKFSKNPAIEDVIAHYVEIDGLTGEETTELEMGSTLTKYTSPDVRQQVWHLFVKGGHHGWPSMSINKIDTNTLIMEFLETQKPE